MPRVRESNVVAAQWSPNGGSLGQADLTQPGANVFGDNVFSGAVQRRDAFCGVAVETAQDDDAGIVGLVAVVQDEVLAGGA